MSGWPRARRWALGLAATVALSAGCRVTLQFAPNDGGPSSASGCASDQECPLTSLHCDVGSGQCFQCVGNADCSSVSGHPICDTAKHICVQCGVSGDCPTGWRCQAEICLQNCTTNADCSTAGLWCDDDDDICAQCDDPHDCPTSAPYCGPTHQCVACVLSSQCSAPTARCNPNTGRCVACLTSSDCESGTICDPADWICKVPPP